MHGPKIMPPHSLYRRKIIAGRFKFSFLKLLKSRWGNNAFSMAGICSSKSYITGSGFRRLPRLYPGNITLSLILTEFCPAWSTAGFFRHFQSWEHTLTARNCWNHRISISTRFIERLMSLRKKMTIFRRSSIKTARAYASETQKFCIMTVRISILR